MNNENQNGKPASEKRSRRTSEFGDSFVADSVAFDLIDGIASGEHCQMGDGPSSGTGDGGVISSVIGVAGDVASGVMDAAGAAVDVAGEAAVGAVNAAGSALETAGEIAGGVAEVAGEVVGGALELLD